MQGYEFPTGKLSDAQRLGIWCFKRMQYACCLLENFRQEIWQIAALTEIEGGYDLDSFEGKNSFFRHFSRNIWKFGREMGFFYARKTENPANYPSCSVPGCKRHAPYKNKYGYERLCRNHYTVFHRQMKRKERITDDISETGNYAGEGAEYIRGGDHRCPPQIHTETGSSWLHRERRIRRSQDNKPPQGQKASQGKSPEARYIFSRESVFQGIQKQEFTRRIVPVASPFIRATVI